MSKSQEMQPEYSAGEPPAAPMLLPEGWYRIGQDGKEYPIQRFTLEPGEDAASAVQACFPGQRVFFRASQPPADVLRELMALVEGKCPHCGEPELHSATINGESAVSCTECEWGSSYRMLRARAGLTKGEG